MTLTRARSESGNNRLIKKVPNQFLNNSSDIDSPKFKKASHNKKFSNPPKPFSRINKVRSLNTFAQMPRTPTEIMP